jgi:hypothetical protein
MRGINSKEVHHMIFSEGFVNFVKWNEFENENSPFGFF